MTSENKDVPNNTMKYSIWETQTDKKQLKSIEKSPIIKKEVILLSNKKTI
ncbi:hypothetical protein [Anaerobacillus alkalidiazotrophicus]|nr:hypothetical protein [Anaerobacillus alkalidiazotrophicus]